MATQKLSAITASLVNPVGADMFVGVHSGTTDLQFSLTQIAAGISTIIPGVPYTLGQAHIPFVLISSGVMGNNGAFSAVTAVATAYPNSYVWFPAGAIAASGTGSAAGWYYTTWSSTTAGTAFNNLYTSGTPTIPGSPTAFSTTAGALVQTTGSNIGAYTLAIAGNTIGVNGTVQVAGTRTHNSSAGAKILTGNFGAFAFATQSVTATTLVGPVGGFSNRGVANVQVALGNGGFGTTAVSTSLPVGAIDSTSSQNLVMNLQIAVATDTMTLENIVVQLIPGVA